MIVEVMDRMILTKLFPNAQDGLLLSCLQNHKGYAYSDDEKHPTCAMLIIDTFCFLAGTANKELLEYRPAEVTKDFMIFTPMNKKWEEMLKETYGSRIKKAQRYAVKKEKDVFDRNLLESYIANIPSGYEIKQIDEAIYHQLMGQSWSRDLCSLYHDAQDYMQHGLGFVIMKNATIVSGASSYVYYDAGIEIEIDTIQEERRKGLALACAAKLILTCMKLGWYASWDAQNKGSLALAEKLGYHRDEPYTVYEIEDYQTPVLKVNEENTDE